MKEKNSNLFDSEKRNQKLALTGSILAAIGASSCCIVPLLLFSLGVSGAWIGQMTKLEPYKPLFIVIALGFLVWGYVLAFRKPKPCNDAQVCAKPLPNSLMKLSLIIVTILTAVALFWPQIVPLILG